MNRLLPVFITLFMLLVFFPVVGQETEEAEGETRPCTDVLDQARIIFDEGRIQDLEEHMKGCLEDPDGFTKEERVQAYRLLAISYIYLDEADKADEMMLQLLKTDPEFPLNRDLEPTEFINLYESFRTDPVFALGIKAGFNSMIMNVREITSTGDLNAEKGNYAFQTGFQAGLSWEKDFGELFTLNPELYFSQKTLKRVDPLSGSQSTLEYIENQTWIELPISLQYKIFSLKFQQSSIKPYVYLGGSINYLILAESQGLSIRETAPEGSSSTFQTTDLALDRKNDLEQLFFTAMIGGGIKYRIPKGFLTADLRFNYGVIENTVDPYSPENADLLFGYNFVPDVVRQNYISLSIGYIKYFYSPKKY